MELIPMKIIFQLIPAMTIGVIVVQMDFVMRMKLVLMKKIILIHQMIIGGLIIFLVRREIVSGMKVKEKRVMVFMI